MLHSASMSSNDILETVAAALHQKYKIPVNFSQMYLKKSWPNANPIQSKPETITNEPVVKTASIIESGAERFKKLFQKL
jgi:ribulose bisphosphate carboxylase small subunit